VSYPNSDDAKRGLSSGIISKKEYSAIVSANTAKKAPPQNTGLGGDICIHGRGTASDWTWGCVALEDTDIKELFTILPVRTPVTIKP
jgi:L,D-peptidoglycan transpeptidase YkuD (ErfK/YbiS/YcfS/YnhG family)